MSPHCPLQTSGATAPHTPIAIDDELRAWTRGPLHTNGEACAGERAPRGSRHRAGQERVRDVRIGSALEAAAETPDTAAEFSGDLLAMRWSSS